LLAIGLMSGTSIDGVDAALIDTDGVHQIDRLAFHSMPYEPGFVDRVRAILGRTEVDAEILVVERELTLLHAKAVGRLLESAGVSARSVGIVGFHGHTIHHEPACGFTWQIGDGALLAVECGIDMVADCRSADVAGGGEGAPLAPVFHAALMAAFDKPVAVLNIGGVANVTWIGKDDALIAFDTGPGNALIDDWTFKNTGNPMDYDGAMARCGDIDAVVLEALLKTPYLKRIPPKSLDRNEFDISLAESLLVEDGAATLTAFTIGCIKASLDYFPAPPARWVVCGGGRLNLALMAGLGSALGVPVEPMEALGWNGDAIEAEAFAYLAVRKLKNLPTSFPETTGVATPTSGGVLHRHKV
jgi:anhydro-N-acetylmuramic acid kinase